MNRYLREITAMLTALGIIDAVVEKTSKHVKILITGPLGTRKVVTSSSPSDHRTMLNFKSDLRRVAREVGALVA